MLVIISGPCGLERDICKRNCTKEDFALSVSLLFSRTGEIDGTLLNFAVKHFEKTK